MKKWIFRLATLLLIYLLLEAVSCGVYAARFGQAFSFDALRQRKAAAARHGGLNLRRQFQGARYLHPYWGFAIWTRAPDGADQTCNTNAWGAFGDFALQGAPEDQVNVLVTGGSFATDAFCNAKKTLARLLGELPAYRGRPINIFAITHGGYKQPQQLLALSYYLSLGGELDLVINIDGFNELNGAVDVAASGVHPSFPGFWRAMVGDQLRAGLVEPRFQIMQHQRSRQRAASVHDRLSFSVTAGLLWALADQGLERDIQQQTWALNKMLKQEGTPPGWMAGGPPHEGDALAYGARLWFNGLTQMAALAEKNGFHVFSFLQPNQYQEGTKPMSAQERAVAIHPGSNAERSVRKGYPLLRELAAKLSSPRLLFSDLSYLFKDVSEALYIDNCCHVNARGYDLVMEAVARVVAKTLAPSPALPPPAP